MKIKNIQRLFKIIMRLIQNFTISWEINFNVKNTCSGKVIAKKNILAHKNSSIGTFCKSKVIFWSIFFDRKWQLKKHFLHYKPCLLTSLSRRKSWKIFAFSSEKIDF
jgi:hypothetical protein